MGAGREWVVAIMAAINLALKLVTFDVGNGAVCFEVGVI